MTTDAGDIIDCMPEPLFSEYVFSYVMHKAPDLADKCNLLAEFLDHLGLDGPCQIAAMLLVLKRIEREAPADMMPARVRSALTAGIEAIASGAWRGDSATEKSQ